MANLTFDIAKGAVAEKVRVGANLILVLLKVAEPDTTLQRYATLSALLAGSNVECNATNYVRKTIANASVTLTVDTTNDLVMVTFANVTWTSLGGATNNSLVKLLICADGASDAVRVPLTAHDFVITTTGANMTAQVPASGVYSAS